MTRRYCPRRDAHVSALATCGAPQNKGEAHLPPLNLPTAEAKSAGLAVRARQNNLGRVPTRMWKRRLLKYIATT